MAITFKSHYREVTAAVQEATDRALEIAGAKAEGYAKINLRTPKPHKSGIEKPNVVTSNLINSITHRQISKDTEVIGTNVEYAPFVELGTSKSWAYPYLRPAAEGHGEEYAKIWASELNKINK
jgi:phage gpG-like protein